MDKHKCSGRVLGGWKYVPCSNTGRHEHEGMWYCKMHHPPTIVAKTKERNRKYLEQAAAESQVWEQKMAERAEITRRAECYPDLLAALKKLLPLAVDSKMRPEFDLDILYARAAIAKAEGE